MPTHLTDDLVCPACMGGLAGRDGVLACRACAAEYPVLQGVPLLLPGIAVATGQAPDRGFVEDLARIAAPSNAPAARESLREVFSSSIVFPDRYLGTEGTASFTACARRASCSATPTAALPRSPPPSPRTPSRSIHPTLGSNWC